MSVLIKSFYFLLILFSIFVVNSASYNICGVSVDEPWFVVKDQVKAEDILIVDRQGDLFLGVKIIL